MKLKLGDRSWILSGFVQIVLQVKIDILNLAVISLKIKDDFNIIQIKFWKGTSYLIDKMLKMINKTNC